MKKRGPRSLSPTRTGKCSPPPKVFTPHISSFDSPSPPHARDMERGWPPHAIHANPRPHTSDPYPLSLTHQPGSPSLSHPTLSYPSHSCPLAHPFPSTTPPSNQIPRRVPYQHVPPASTPPPTYPSRFVLTLPFPPHTPARIRSSPFHAYATRHMTLSRIQLTT